MGEKETSREASAPSLSERSSVQDFEKNTERSGSDDEAAATRGKGIIRNTNSTARESAGDDLGGEREGVVQYNESDLEFRSQSGGGGDAAERASRGKPSKEQ